MGLLHKLDFFLYTKFLFKARIRNILVNYDTSFPDAFLKVENDVHQFCYIDRKNKIAFEVWNMGFASRYPKLNIYVFDDANASFAYIKDDNGYKLSCNSQYIKVFDEYELLKMKGWWDEKIPLSIYSLILQGRDTVKTKIKNDEVDFAMKQKKATSFNPDLKEEEKENDNEGLIL